MTTFQEEFLRSFPAAHPAVTVRTMVHGKAADGRSSDELLRARFEGESAAMALPDGRVPCGMKMQVVTAVRGGRLLRAAYEGRRIGVARQRSDALALEPCRS